MIDPIQTGPLGQVTAACPVFAKSAYNLNSALAYGGSFWTPLRAPGVEDRRERHDRFRVSHTHTPESVQD